VDTQYFPSYNEVMQTRNECQGSREIILKLNIIIFTEKMNVLSDSCWCQNG